MKKSFIYAGAILAATISLTNCTKEINSSEAALPEGIPFEICAASADTKTSIEGFTTSWVANDAINLFHAKAGSTTYTSDAQFKITAETLAENKFTGNLPASLEAGNYDWYAFYPYSKYNKTPAGSSQDDFGFTTIGGTSQTQTGNNSTAHLCGKVCPLYGVAKSVASSATPGITMNHLTSIIEVNVTNNSGADLTVSNVSFTGTEDIVGTYFIDFTGETVEYTGRGDSYVSEKASLTVNNGTAIADKGSATFYIAIKPFTVSSGVLKVAVNGYEKEINIKTETVFAAGKIKTINFNYNPEPSIQMGPDWNAIFGTSHDGSFSTKANELSLNGQKEEVSIAVRNGKSTNGYMKSGDFRMYDGYTVTLTPPSGKIITRVSTTKGGSKDFSSGIAANTGTVSISSGSLKWLGKSTHLVMTISATVSFNTMNITIDDAPSEKTKLTSPTVSCFSQTANSLTFTWSAVENATGYQVSVDGGNTYGDTQNETSYTWTGLTASTTKTLYVKAIGDNIFYADSDATSAEGTTTAGSGTGEGGGENVSYSIVFKKANQDGSTEISGTTKSSTVVSEGIDYITSFSSNCSKAYYAGVNGVKLGTKSAVGTLEFSLADVVKNNVVSIKVETAQYGSDTGTITMYNGSTELKSEIAPANGYTHDFTSPTTVASLKFVTSSKRAYISKITITVAN